MNFKKKNFHDVVNGWEKFDFIEYMPISPATGKLSLIVSLHGLGENGTGTDSDLAKVDGTGLPKALNAGTYDKYSNIVVLAPQVKYFWSADQVEYYFKYLYHKYLDAGIIDPNSVFLTGYSAGGEGTWNAVIANGTQYDCAQYITAAIPIEGAPDSHWNPSSFTGSNVAKYGIAMAIFHNDFDTTEAEQKEIDDIALLNASADQAQIVFSHYPVSGHWGWDQVYGGDTAHFVNGQFWLDWAISKAKNTATPTPTVTCQLYEDGTCGMNVAGKTAQYQIYSDNTWK